MATCNHDTAVLGRDRILRTCVECGALVKPAIAVTFDVVTPESAADGDIASSGWDTAPDGDEIDWDTDADGTSDDGSETETSLVAAAVKYIRYSAGAVEASSYPRWHRGTWYRECDPRQDRDHFERGIDRFRSYHLRGFTEGELRAIFAELTDRSE